MTLSKNTLWARLIATTEQALCCGALVPVPTSCAHIDDSGVRFSVRVLSNLQRKDEARKKQDAESKQGRTVNPFLPPEKELTVAHITGSHTAILNKFNVMDRHLLIITRQFEDQDMLLTMGDFEALRICMNEYNCLGFYNGGREAGASQQHKHLQVVPLPLAPGGPSSPIEPLLSGIRAGDSPVTVPAFPFVHAFVRMAGRTDASRGDAAKKLFDLYSALLHAVGMTRPHPSQLTRQSMPYCLLITREWMLLVPRTREFFEDISFNSLAFAGSLFVRNEAQFERLKAYGPMNALKAVALVK